MISLLKELSQNEKELSELLSASSQFSEARFLKNIPFFSSIMSSGLFSLSEPFPSVEDLGIKISIDFVGVNWRTVAIGQINLLNYWMFFRFPTQIQTLGKTKTGQWLVKALHLQSMVNKIASLPHWARPIAMWMIIETADGCMARYIYTGIISWNKLSKNRSEAIENLIQKRFTHKK